MSNASFSFRRFFYNRLTNLSHLVAFAHGLFIYLRGQTVSSPATFTGTLSNGVLVDISQVVDSSTNKFMRFDMSLKATYFFLTGDYSSIGYWDGDPVVDIIRVILLQTHFIPSHQKKKKRKFKQIIINHFVFFFRYFSVLLQEL